MSKRSASPQATEAATATRNLMLKVPFTPPCDGERSRPYHLDLQLKTHEAEALDGVFRAMHADHERIPGTVKHVDTKADVVRHLIAQVQELTQ